ncbi:MAG: hypothetical protein ACTJHU_00835 [Mycetocola sp.]
MLTAVGLEGGMDGRRSRQLASQECERANIDVADGAERSRDVMHRAALFGAPVAAALRAEGKHLRAEQASAGLIRVAELPGRLILPLGLCILPAFFAVGIVPAVLSVVSSSLLR